MDGKRNPFSARPRVCVIIASRRAGLVLLLIAGAVLARASGWVILCCVLLTHGFAVLSFSFETYEHTLPPAPCIP